jgi:RHS repeat-associated protein
LNQYTQRDVPGAADIIGIAHANASVTVHPVRYPQSLISLAGADLCLPDEIAYRVIALSHGVNGSSPYRRGEYFWKELSINNTNAAVWQAVTNIASLTGTNQTNRGNLFLSKTPETFGYDADGNIHPVRYFRIICKALDSQTKLWQMSKSRLCKLSHGAGDGRFSYTWDAENRLTQVESLSSSPTASKRKVVWQYDGQGRRVRQTTYNGGSGSYVVTNDLKFVADGWRHVAELNATNSVLIRSYVWGLDLSGRLGGAGGVGGLVALNSKANGVHFAAYDGNGNIVALADGRTGTASVRYEHGPFAEPLRSSGSLATENPFRFSTKRTDDTADLTLYEYRALRPTTGRWLSRDPMLDRLSSKLRVRLDQEILNLYHFAYNEPLANHDFLGLAVNVCDRVTIPTSRVPCEKNCGLDYTASLNSEIQRLFNHLATVPPIRFTGIRAFDACIETEFLLWFRQLALSINYDWQARQLSIDDSGCPIRDLFCGCPTLPCLSTITLCGKCVTDDVPGNILYGIAAAPFLTDLGRDIAAFFAEFDGDPEWPEEDYPIFDLGKELYQTQNANICAIVNRLPTFSFRNDCKVCNQIQKFRPLQFPVPSGLCWR